MSLPTTDVLRAQPGRDDSMLADYSEAELDGFLAAATEIAREAGALVAASYEQGHQEDQKGHAHNLVTETDRASEALIVDRLRSRFPGHGIRAEEGGGSEAPPGGIIWVVDPLDGTNNFAHGLPIFAVSMAAMAGEAVLAGVTYDPLRDELFAARLGGGAWLNGRRLAVSKRERLESSIVATGFPYDKASNPDNNLAQFAAVTPRVRGIRRLGSAALDLAYVAAGRMEAYWERGTYAWDVAAGVLMVQEAGGRVTDYAGRPARVDGGQFLASNARIHAELQAVLAAVGP
jgi:myo-inositol-1(or 4)-monophosphatase